jgi:hypothetical protein
MFLFLISVDSVYVKVFNRTLGRFVSDSLRVEVAGFFTDGKEVFDTVEIKGEGWIRIPKDPHVVGLTVIYKGERFPSQPIILNDTSRSVTVEVYDVSGDRSDISVVSHNLGIFKEKGVYHIVELVEFKNSSNRAFRGPILELKLPKKSEGFNITGDQSDYFRSGQNITLTPLLLPGEGNFGFDYFVLSDYFSLKREGAENYRVFADTSIRVKVKNAVFDGRREFEGQFFNVWKAKGKVEIEVGTPPLLRETVMFLWASLLFVFLVAIIFFVLRRP